jgi:hypothetical protein
VRVEVLAQAFRDLDQVRTDLAAEEIFHRAADLAGEQARHAADLLRVDGERPADLERRAAIFLGERVDALAGDGLGEGVGHDPPLARPICLIPLGDVRPRQHGFAQDRARCGGDLAAAVPDVLEIHDVARLGAALDLDAADVRQVLEQVHQLVAVGGVDDGAGERELGVGSEIHRAELPSPRPEGDGLREATARPGC